MNVHSKFNGLGSLYRVRCYRSEGHKTINSLMPKTTHNRIDKQKVVSLRKLLKETLKKKY